MRIQKIIKGWTYHYYIKFFFQKMTCEVRHLESDEPVIGTISEDLKYIHISQPFVHYIEGEYITIDKLKIPKEFIPGVKDYVETK